MQLRQTHRLLWSASAALLAAAILCALGLFVPLDPAARVDSSSASLSSTVSGPIDPNRPLVASIDPALARPLRRPLQESAPAPPAAASAPQPQVASSLTLVGTIGTSLAMIRTADGSVSAKGVGEQIGGAEILAIRPAQVDVRINGRSITLEKPRQSPSP